MISPEWYYSTIAQASAAIIGLTIAFTISTHLSRRERRRKRTDEAREEAVALKQKYQPLMDTIARTIKDSSNIDSSNTRYELEDVSSVEEWASDQNNPVSARIWALTSGISHVLSDFSLLSAEPSRNQIEILQNAVQELEYRLLYRNNGNDETLYTEVVGRPIEEADNHYYSDDIFEENDRISAWLDRNRRTRDENIAGARPSDLTGKNILSLVTIMEIIDADLDEFGVNAVESDLTADFLQQNFGTYVLSTSMKLAAFGIFLPILFLISLPDFSLPMWAIERIPSIIFDAIDIGDALLHLAMELIIFIMTSFYTLRLFTIMVIDMNTTVPTMAELLGESDEDEQDNESDLDTESTKSDVIQLIQRYIQLAQFKSLPTELQDSIRGGS